MKVLEFWANTILLLPDNDGNETEDEVQTKYRALFETDHRGHVTELRFERDETRPGKPELWVMDAAIPLNWKTKVLRQIEENDRAEQRRMADLVDQEYA